MRKRKEFLGIVPGEWRHAVNLRAEARDIRRNVAEFNNRYGTDADHLDYILSGNEGYRMTRNLNEIEDAINRDYDLAIKRLNEIQKRKRHLDQVINAKRHGGEIE